MEDIKEEPEQEQEIQAEVVRRKNKPREKKPLSQGEINKNFYVRNKEKISQQRVCDTCLGFYTYFNRSKHNKSFKHLQHLEHKTRTQQATILTL
jgi:hypothetical protein